MIKKYYDADCNLGMLDGKTVAVMGYGSQGHAHAQNLKESGVKVVVGLRRGSASWAKAEQAGLTVMEVPEAAKAADIVMMLVPDEIAADIGALCEDAAAETREDGDQRRAESERHQRIDHFPRAGRMAHHRGEDEIIDGYAEQREARHQHAGNGA